MAVGKDLQAPELSYQEGKGFKKSIGYYKGEDGKLRQKVWWLGHHKETAQQAVRLLMALYADQGDRCWTPDGLDEGKAIIADLKARWDKAIASARLMMAQSESSALPPPKPEKPAEPELVWFHDGCDAMAAELRKRYENNDLSDAYVSRAGSAFNNFKQALPNIPIRSIDVEKLKEVQLWYQNALGIPKGRPGHKAWDTVKTELNLLRSVLRFFHTKGWWNKHQHEDWEKTLRPRFNSAAAVAVSILRPQDRIRIYTVDQLADLFWMANPRQRRDMLMGLNFAWTQIDIATTCKSHWHEDGVVRRLRHKKAPNSPEPIYGEWTAWPETLELARHYMAQTTDDPKLNPHGLAFLSENNLPLVRRLPTESDAVGESFKRLCETAKVPYYGYKALRKTAATMVEKIADHRTAEMMLCHAVQGISYKHYIPADWEELHRALKEMHIRLEPMFQAAFKPKPKRKYKKRRKKANVTAEAA